MRHYRRGISGGFTLGRRHGLFCLGCCWALMLVMFVAGVASLIWMGALTVLMVYEKTAARGAKAVPAAGIALLAWRPSSSSTHTGFRRRCEVAPDQNTTERHLLGAARPRKSAQFAYIAPSGGDEIGPIRLHCRAASARPGPPRIYCSQIARETPQSLLCSLTCRQRRRSVASVRHGAFAAMSAVAVVLASVTLPATATAATVFTREADLNGELVPWTFFEAAPGEANRVTATDVADFSAARWVEAGAPLVVLPECSAAAGAAICPRSPVQVDLGDRADVAQVMLPNAEVLLLNAGDGADDVFADFFLGNVSGEGGDDRIRLGDSPARARVFGGAGRDVILGGGGGRELFGGPGGDFIVFEAPVGEVHGEDGNDVLRLAHVPPSDNLAAADGGSGNDVLVVGRNQRPPDPPPFIGSRAWWLAGGMTATTCCSVARARDMFVGGAGADLLFARDGMPEDVGCGDGFDVAFVDGDDTLSGCEVAVGMSSTAAVPCACRRRARGDPVDRRARKRAAGADRPRRGPLVLKPDGHATP